MSIVAAPATASPHAGRTVLRPLALRRVAQAIVAELAGVRPSEVSIALADAGGMLAIEATTPLNLGTARASGTLVERAAALTNVLSDRFADAAGRRVGRVDVRLTRLAVDQGPRRAT